MDVSFHENRTTTDLLFRTSVMIPIREKNFFMCIGAIGIAGTPNGVPLGRGTVMIYIRGTYQSQNFPIPEL